MRRGWEVPSEGSLRQRLKGRTLYASKRSSASPLHDFAVYDLDALCLDSLNLADNSYFCLGPEERQVLSKTSLLLNFSIMIGPRAYG